MLDTQMATRVTDGARRERHEEKEKKKRHCTQSNSSRVRKQSRNENFGHFPSIEQLFLFQ